MWVLFWRVNGQLWSPTASAQTPEMLIVTHFFEGFSRVKARPAGRVRKLSKPRGSRRVGPGAVQKITGRIGSGHEIVKSHGSGGVGLTRPDPRKLTRPVKSCFCFNLSGRSSQVASLSEGGRYSLLVHCCMRRVS